MPNSNTLLTNTHSSSNTSLFIGVMSGTSLDGVDAVLVDFAPPDGFHPHPALQLPLQIIARQTLPIPVDLRQELLTLHTPSDNEIHRAQCAARACATLYADAIEALLAQVPDIPRHHINAAGVHGQTIRHCPESGYSVQLNAPALIAERTGLTIISDFRNADIAAGGQGAPLVPGFHAALLATKENEIHAVLNLGGIANITLIQTTAIKGWDCGPANMLLDAWCQQHTGHPFDADGAWGKAGRILPKLLNAMLKDSYFAQSPPKSTGRDYFNTAWLEQYIQLHAHAETPQDIQATLAALTAETIANDLAPYAPEIMWVGGGGAHNKALLELLEEILHAKGCKTIVTPFSELGIPATDLEGAAFAWLAQQHILRLPGNLPSVTGAQGFRQLGHQTPGRVLPHTPTYTQSH